MASITSSVREGERVEMRASPSGVRVRSNGPGGPQKIRGSATSIQGKSTGLVCSVSTTSMASLPRSTRTICIATDRESSWMRSL